MVHERGGEALGNVPPSIEALLASRFDLLKPDERRLVERAAVVGAEFSREDVTALFAAETLANLSAHVLGLVGKGLIRPARSARGEELFRFHHEWPIAKLPTLRPTCTPVVQAKRKWKPTTTRESAFSSSACVKLFQHRWVLAGTDVVDVMQKRKWSCPVNRRRISAAAPPRRLWVEG